MATWPPDSTKKAPNIFFDTVDKTGPLPVVEPPPPSHRVPPPPPPDPPPQPITLLPFLMNNAPPFINSGVTVMPFNMVARFDKSFFTFKIVNVGITVKNYDGIFYTAKITPVNISLKGNGTTTFYTDNITDVSISLKGP